MVDCARLSLEVRAALHHPAACRPASRKKILGDSTFSSSRLLWELRFALHLNQRAILQRRNNTRCELDFDNKIWYLETKKWCMRACENARCATPPSSVPSCKQKKKTDMGVAILIS
jgi:hypothetical protein